MPLPPHPTQPDVADTADRADTAPPRSSQSAQRAERSERTRELLLRAHAVDDPAERARLLDEVIVLNRGVARAVASRYRDRGVASDDLEQAAMEGLVKAVQRFDPEVREDLLTYAVPTIRGEVQRWFRDRGWMVRPPRRIQEMQWRIGRSIETLSQQLGREPTTAEITEELGYPREEVEEAVRGFGCFSPASLDMPIDPNDDATLGEVLPDLHADSTAAAEARAVLAPAVRRLSERDRRIVFLSFFEQRTQAAIGGELGITQVQVSRHLTRIVRDLRAEFAPELVTERGAG